jgi:hypothetical protein
LRYGNATAQTRNTSETRMERMPLANRLGTRCRRGPRCPAAPHRCRAPPQVPGPGADSGPVPRIPCGYVMQRAGRQSGDEPVAESRLPASTSSSTSRGKPMKKYSEKTWCVRF